MKPPQEAEFLRRVPARSASGAVFEEIHYLPVEQHRAQELIAVLPHDRHIQFLIILASSLTVNARAAAHMTDLFTDTQARARLRDINEMMHGLIHQIAAVVSTDADRTYTPAQFCQSLYGTARAGGFEVEFATYDVAPALWGALAPGSR